MTVKDWITMTATIVIPLVIALTGWWVSSAIEESQKRVKYVELAIGILHEAPSSDTEHTRNWAIRVMKKYSDVPIPEEMERELRTKKFLDTLSFSEMLGIEVKRGKQEPK